MAWLAIALAVVVVVFGVMALFLSRKARRRRIPA
jgi:hypothetical protein